MGGKKDLVWKIFACIVVVWLFTMIIAAFFVDDNSKSTQGGKTEIADSGKGVVIRNTLVEAEPAVPIDIKQEMAELLSYYNYIDQFEDGMDDDNESLLEEKILEFMRPVSVTTISLWSGGFYVFDQNLGEVDCFLNNYYSQGIVIYADGFLGRGTKGPTYNRYLPVCQRVVPRLKKAYKAVVEAHRKMQSACDYDDMLCDDDGDWVRRFNF